MLYSLYKSDYMDIKIYLIALVITQNNPRKKLFPFSAQVNSEFELLLLHMMDIFLLVLLSRTQEVNRKHLSLK